MNRVRSIGVIAALVGLLWGAGVNAQGQKWHGYILITFGGTFAGGLNTGQDVLVRDAFTLLAPTKGSWPPYLLQYRANLLRTEIIVEAQWTDITKESVVTALASKLGYIELVISNSIIYKVFCPSALPDCSWDQSRELTLQYLAENRAAWEQPQ